MADFDWNDLRFFLTLVRLGNARDAGQQLRVNHTTVRRRVRALEVALSTTLIQPGRNAMTLTEQGEEMIRIAESVESRVLSVPSHVPGADLALTGRVRVGAPDGVASFFLAPHLVRLRDLHPGLDIELFAISREFNIANRDAEIAIVISRPPPSRHRIRKLTTAYLRLYASAGYLQSRPPIREVADLAGHDFIGYLNDHPFIPKEMSDLPAFERFRSPNFSSNSIVVQGQAAGAGGGICLMPGYMAAALSNLCPILSDQVVIPIDVYMLTHADLIEIARFRMVADFILEQVATHAELFT